MIVWITGRPASGKTTLARALAEALRARGRSVEIVDSDEVRAVITPQATYSKEERAIVYRSFAYLARRLAEAGRLVIVAATAHDPALRSEARAIASAGGARFVLVHAKASAETCEARDPKGLYRAARARARGTMPGVQEPWSDPDDADLVVETDRPVEIGTVLGGLDVDTPSFGV
jgi:adenylylsulfate kinase-like enzyme